MNINQEEGNFSVEYRRFEETNRYMSRGVISRELVAVKKLLMAQSNDRFFACKRLSSF